METTSVAFSYIQPNKITQSNVYESLSYTSFRFFLTYPIQLSPGRENPSPTSPSSTHEPPLSIAYDFPHDTTRTSFRRGKGTKILHRIRRPLVLRSNRFCTPDSLIEAKKKLYCTGNSMEIRFYYTNRIRQLSVHTWVKLTRNVFERVSTNGIFFRMLFSALPPQNR